MHEHCRKKNQKCGKSQLQVKVVLETIKIE